MKRRPNPPLPEIDWPLVCKRLLNPERPDFPSVMGSVRAMLAEHCLPGCMRGPVVARVAALTHPSALAEMWERLAPVRWVDESARGFIRLGYLPRLYFHNQSINWKEIRETIPTSIELMASLVSDRANVEKAERLAEEYAHRLGPWMKADELRASRGRRVSWALLDPEWSYGIEPELMTRPVYAMHLVINHRRYWGPDTNDGESDEVPLRFDDDSSYARASSVSKEMKARGASSFFAGGRKGVIPWQPAMMNCTTSIAWLRMWQDMERLGSKVRESMSARFIPGELVGKRFRDLSNPFAPIAELYELGYVVVDISPTDMVLGVPWMAPPMTGPTWRSMGMDSVSARRASIAPREER